MSTSSVPKNPPPLKPGMDNPWYDYAPFPLRPKLTWPRNARVASFVLLHLEYWELIPDESSYRDPRHAGEVHRRHRLLDQLQIEALGRAKAVRCVKRLARQRRRQLERPKPRGDGGLFALAQDE